MCVVIHNMLEVVCVFFKGGCDVVSTYSLLTFTSIFYALSTYFFEYM
jgi:hypothetical protein